jgi:hypothetical protein
MTKTAAGTEAIHQALGGKTGKPRPVHTHGVHYERADNGGVRAHVTKHYGKSPKSEGHSHTEEHVLPNMEAAQEHLQEHMGDQPAAGEMPTAQAAIDPDQEQDGGAGGGDAAPPEM